MALGEEGEPMRFPAVEPAADRTTTLFADRRDLIDCKPPGAQVDGLRFEPVAARLAPIALMTLELLALRQAQGRDVFLTIHDCY